MQDNARRHFDKGVRSDDPKCVAGETNESRTCRCRASVAFSPRNMKIILDGHDRWLLPLLYYQFPRGLLVFGFITCYKLLVAGNVLSVQRC